MLRILAFYRSFESVLVQVAPPRSVKLNILGVLTAEPADELA
jgi:hypothetical protein